MADLKKEIENRRTFAIISHPDAGKTTITEKFLLYGGAIQGGRHGQGQEKQPSCGFRLDGDREAARYFGNVLGAAVPL